MWKNFVTIRAASEILGVSPQTLRNWDRDGILRAERDRKTDYRLYDISALQAFARANPKLVRKTKRPRMRLVP